MAAKHRVVCSLAVLATALLTSAARADGTEKLGPPLGLVLERGSAVLMAGVGMVNQATGTVKISVPQDVKIVQVLAYWEGQAKTETEHGDFDTVALNAMPVRGKRIGGPTFFFVTAWTSSYRADVTALGLVKNGDNSISVAGLDFGVANNGLGLLVIVDDEKTTTNIQLQDGNDCAFVNFASPLDTTVPVVFNFPAANEPRQASLGYFVSSVALMRPSIIEIKAGNNVVRTLIDALGNLDGPEWDTLQHAVTVPAGATSLSVQLLSKDSGSGQYKGGLPASMTWVTSTLTLSAPQMRYGGYTPGFWKNHEERWDGRGNDDLTDTIKAWSKFNAVFDVTQHYSSVDDDTTLIEACATGGGHIWALNRHAAAAIANADSAINYLYSKAEVIKLYQDGVDKIAGPETIESAKNKLEAANEHHASLLQLGTSCGSPWRSPTLYASLPQLGQPQTLWGENAYNGSIGIILLGVPNSFPIQFGDCQGWINPTLYWTVMHAWVTKSDWDFRWLIPSVPALVNVEIGQQAWFFGTDAPLGVELTNGVLSVIGK